MFRQNRRKRRLDGSILPTPLGTAAVLAAVLGLAYVWLCCRCEHVGRDLRLLEAEREALTKKYLAEESNWAWTKSPANIERVLKAHNIVMVWPRSSQILRISDFDMSLSACLELADNARTRRRGGKAVMND